MFNICFSTKRCKGNQFAQGASVPDLLIRNKALEHLDVPEALNRFVCICYYKSPCGFNDQLDVSCSQFY